MITRSLFVAVATTLSALSALAAQPKVEGAPWNQFRGPGGSGVAESCSPPVAIDSAKATWDIAIPPGHSSPVLAGKLIVVTAVDGDTLVTLAINKKTGQPAWRKEAPQSPIEKVHRTGSPAASTPCADDERIYVYFGSYGLICYDLQGGERWKKPIPTPSSMYGMSTSPILHGDQVILVLDNDANVQGSKLSASKIIALNKTNGELMWETQRPFHRSGWSTPTIWKHKEGVELVVLGNGRLCGYDAATGNEKWFVNGFSRETIAVPIVGDGRIFASASMLGGMADDQPDPLPFWDAVMRFDANKDGKLTREEMTEHFAYPLRPDLPVTHPGFGLPLPSDAVQRSKRLDGVFAATDKNKDGFWTKEEFLSSISFNRGKPNLISVRPGGQGDVTESHIAWSLHRGIPEIPCPIYHRDRIHLVRDGGVLRTIAAESGKTIYESRLGAGGHYRASPVIANNHLYMISEEGVVSVVKTGDEFTLVHQHALKDSVAATPAIDASTIYIRTKARLFAFRNE